MTNGSVLRFRNAKILKLNIHVLNFENFDNDDG